MQYLVIISIAVISYLIGSVNFSILLSKAVSGKDIRDSGSGNAGATNMLRTHGKKMAIITLVLDVLKGIVAISLTSIIALLLFVGSRMYYDMLGYISGVCVILGHNFPIYFGFKGGKGVATSLGVVLTLDWKIGLAVVIVAIAIMAITKYVSLGSIIGGALYIILETIHTTYTKFSNGDKLFFAVEIVCIVIMGGLLVVRHHANIGRLLKGTENKLSFNK